MSAHVYPGLVIDLREYRKLPECFMNVKTMKGSDRGTNIFRIESPAHVEVNATHIDLSVWRCDATPISEKTGKDMSGASHGADSRQFVRLQAQVVNTPDFDVHGEEFIARAHLHLLKFVEKAEAAASARFLASVQQFDSAPEPVATSKPKARKP